MEHGRRMIFADVPSLFGLGLEDSHVPTVASTVGHWLSGKLADKGSGSM